MVPNFSVSQGPGIPSPWILKSQVKVPLTGASSLTQSCWPVVLKQDADQGTQCLSVICHRDAGGKRSGRGGVYSEPDQGFKNRLRMCTQHSFLSFFLSIFGSFPTNPSYSKIRNNSKGLSQAMTRPCHCLALFPIAALLSF